MLGEYGGPHSTQRAFIPALANMTVSHPQNLYYRSLTTWKAIMTEMLHSKGAGPCELHASPQDVPYQIRKVNLERWEEMI